MAKNQNNATPKSSSALASSPQEASVETSAVVEVGLPPAVDDPSASSVSPPVSPEEERAEYLADLEEHRAFLQSELAGVQRERFALQQKEAELTRQIDAITLKLETEAPPPNTMETIQQYIERQKQVREERALRKRQLLTAGVDSSELRSMNAPVDQQLSQRRKTDRPNVAKAAA